MVKICDPHKIVLGQKEKTELTIFLDMDGVVSNWIEAGCRVCDVDIEDPEIRAKIKEEGTLDAVLDEEEYWPKIAKQGQQWWANLDLLPWAKDLWDELNKLSDEVCFLTSPSSEPDCASGKVEWIKKHFDTKSFLIGSKKYLCANLNTILIDDSKKKIDKFEEYGGNVFLWPEALSLLDGDIDIEKTKKDLFVEIKKLQGK